MKEELIIKEYFNSNKDLRKIIAEMFINHISSNVKEKSK